MATRNGNRSNLGGTAHPEYRQNSNAVNLASNRDVDRPKAANTLGATNRAGAANSNTVARNSAPPNMNSGGDPWILRSLSSDKHCYPIPIVLQFWCPEPQRERLRRWWKTQRLNTKRVIGVVPAWERLTARAGEIASGRFTKARQRSQKGAVQMANNSTLPDSKAMSSVMCTMLIAVWFFLAQAAQAQATGQRTFSSFEGAVRALSGAIRSGDSTELLAIYGPGSSRIVIFRR